MNPTDEITDSEFVPFLQSLGVDRHKMSFEWMLTDSECSGVLRWMYNNLDNNNALSAREEYRYSEIEKCNLLLTPEELESTVNSIQDQFPGICLPGDQEMAEDVKLDISMQKERLAILEKQHRVINNLISQNELMKEELSLETTRLKAAQQQLADEETATADECFRLSKEVEGITESVLEVVSDALTVYGSVHSDRDISRKFYTFGPFDTYRQSQALFRSHFDLFVSKKFGHRQNDDVCNEELRNVLVEARNLEERLTDAANAYITSKAQLSGEYAKLSFVSNYIDVHPSQITLSMLEARSAIEVQEQEESILEQRIEDAIKQLVEERTRLAVEIAKKSALAVREQIYTDLSHLLETTYKAWSLDKLVYCALRHELRNIEEVIQLSAHLMQYVLGEAEAQCTRIESMNEICAEQEVCEIKQQTSNYLLHSLLQILGATPSCDEMAIVKVYSDLRSKIAELKESVEDGYRRKEERIVAFKNSTKPLRDYIWDGCTKQPNCWDRTVASLTHTLKQDMEEIDKKVLEASGLFTTVKFGDKNGLRKLWQWFLADQEKLFAAIRGQLKN